MNYFELQIAPDTTNPINMQGVSPDIYRNNSTLEEFSAVASLIVAYFDNTPQLEIYDATAQPAFIVSDSLKRVFSLYEPQMQFKGIQLYANDLEDNTSPLYWWPFIPPIECLSNETTKYPTGNLKNLVLDYDKISTRQIFRVADLLEFKVVVSLAVAESMLRRKMTGFTLKPVVFSRKEHDAL